jgi:hypothetical protein
MVLRNPHEKQSFPGPGLQFLGRPAYVASSDHYSKKKNGIRL